MGVVITATDVRVDNGTFSIINDVLPSCAGTDAVQVDSGTGFPTVRFLKNLVWGRDGAGDTSNTTTWTDTNLCLTFDATRTISTRTTNLTNLNINLGAKVTGSGNVNSGGNGVVVLQAPTTTTALALRGVVKLYGSRFAKKYVANTQNCQFSNLQAGSEIINTQLDGFTTYILGSSGAPFDLAYNTDISRPNTSGTANIVTAFFVTQAERMTIASLRAADASVAVQSSTAGLSFKETIWLGDFTVGVLNAQGANPNWILVSPRWPSGANLFLNAGAIGTADNGCHEYWPYDVKIVNGVTGASISGIPVRLTDAQGNVQVNTTSDSSGAVTFGSGITANAVIVVDHYSDGVVNNQVRHRSPFLAEINLPSMAGYNSNYASQRYYFNWPGYETYSKSNGTMEAVTDPIYLLPAGGTPTTWTERTAP